MAMQQEQKIMMQEQDKTQQVKIKAIPKDTCHMQTVTRTPHQPMLQNAFEKQHILATSKTQAVSDHPQQSQTKPVSGIVQHNQIQQNFHQLQQKQAQHHLIDTTNTQYVDPFLSQNKHII